MYKRTEVIVISETFFCVENNEQNSQVLDKIKNLCMDVTYPIFHYIDQVRGECHEHEVQKIRNNIITKSFHFYAIIDMKFHEP